MNPFTALKNFSPFHFTSLYIYFFFHLSYQPFTSLYFAIHIYNLYPFTSLAFTFYFLSPSLPPLFCTFLTLFTYRDTKTESTCRKEHSIKNGTRSDIGRLRSSNAQLCKPQKLQDCHFTIHKYSKAVS